LAKAVARAGLSDLKAVDGISEKMAENLHAFYQGDG
jgi:excinuclease ABC subunit C